MQKVAHSLSLSRSPGTITDGPSATDRFNALAVDILPFIFVGKHDPQKSVNEVFEKAWTENTGGSGAIKLYLKEIITLAQMHLASQRWALKQTAALSLADACKSIGKDLSVDQVDMLWPVLVSATSGKSWEGKEAVLDALVALATNAVEYFRKDQSRLQELTKVAGSWCITPPLLYADIFTQIVLREAKRKNPSYRCMAIKSLGDFVDSFSSLNLFEKTYSVVADSAADGAEDAMDVDVVGGLSLKSM